MNTLSVKLPDVGEGVTEAELAEWHVEVGDIVREDDIVAVVMTDKASVEIPSLYSGRIMKLGGEIGDILPVGSDLVLIELFGDIAPGSVMKKPEAEQARKPHPKARAKTAPETPASEPDSRPAQSESTPVLASPAVRARAIAAGIDLRQIAGSGTDGRITDIDLDGEFSRLAKGTGNNERRTRAMRVGTEEIKVTGMRRKIAERMELANERIVHITVVEEVDVSALEDLRAKLNADRGEKPRLTLLPFIVMVIAKAVTVHPKMNAHYDDAAGVIRRFAGVHVGIATMTDDGLVVPVVKHAESLGLFELAAEIARLSENARAGKSEPENLTGSTITVSSLGPLGALASTPIINHPEVAILGINKIAVRPIWDGSQFVPRRMMNVSASFDHRVIDGWDAAMFVQKVKSLIESPALIFLEE